MLQAFSPYKGEAGIFYVRYPGEKRGRITSLTVKHFPSVAGDGTSTLRQLIEADPRAGRVTGYYFPQLKDRFDDVPNDGQHVSLVFTGNHFRGAVFKDGAPYVSEAMNRKFEEISQEIDGFWFGRYDVLYGDLEALMRGEDFTIIEVNGAGAEATHIWDSNMRLLAAYRILFIQYRTAFEIGAAARKRGMKPVPAWVVIKQYLSEIVMLKKMRRK